MIPATLSASSLQVYEMCPVRWSAEYLHRSRGYSNSAADTGTAYHGGLERFLKALYLDKTHSGMVYGDPKELLNLLVTMYQMSYVETFKTPDMDTNEYKDGLELTRKWFKRQKFSADGINDGTVESAELKETILVPFNHPDGTKGQLSFNYIMDRVDQIGETEWRVVDYKTTRMPLQPDDLVNKIQARAYALAIQIKHPEATRIKVIFDQIRHVEVGMTFTREDNVKFWEYLVARTQEIIDADESTIRPVLNPECGYCPVKATCKVLNTNVAIGGIHSLSPDEAAEKFTTIKDQIAGLTRLKDELSDVVMMHAAQTDTLKWDVASGDEVAISAPKQRSFDAQVAATIMGPELFAQVGKLNLGELDKIISDDSLPQDMRDQLRGIIHEGLGSLRLSVKPKKNIL